MPVRKFRSVEDMDPPPCYRAGDPALYRSIRMLWDFARRANPRPFQPGVRKYRSIDDMSQAQDEREVEYVRELRRQRRKP